MKRNAAVAWVCGVFAALPLLEIYRSFLQSRVQILGLAAEELFLLIASLSVLLLGTAFALKEKAKKRLAAVYGALALLFVFTLIHAAWAAGFDASLVPAAAPSFATECYYVLRLYLAPIALLGGLVLLEISPRELMPAVKICAGIFACVVLFSALTGLGFATYQSGNTRLRGSVLAWVFRTGDPDFRLYTVKGLFSDGNALGAVLVILTPVVCREALAKTRTLLDIALCFAVPAAGIAVGTRVGSLGALAAFVLSVGIAVICGVRKKDAPAVLRRCIPVGAVLAALLVLYVFSPGLELLRYRQYSATLTREPREELTEVLAEGPQDNALLSPYVENYGWDHHIDNWFREIYPVENDPEFWYEAVKRDGRLNRDNRLFKTEMIARIMQRDGRAGDPLFGIGRTSGVPYSEKDLAFQGQVYGLIGAVMLLLPFAGAGVTAALSGVMRFFKREDATLPLALCMSIAAAFGAAYLAGHVFDTTVTTYVLILPSALAFARRET